MVRIGPAVVLKKPASAFFCCFSKWLQFSTRSVSCCGVKKVAFLACVCAIVSGFAFIF